jgi:hypothetical protein
MAKKEVWIVDARYGVHWEPAVVEEKWRGRPETGDEALETLYEALEEIVHDIAADEGFAVAEYERPISRDGGYDDWREVELNQEELVDDLCDAATQSLSMLDDSAMKFAMLDNTTHWSLDATITFSVYVMATSKTAAIKIVDKRAQREANNACCNGKVILL